MMTSDLLAPPPRLRPVTLGLNGHLLIVNRGGFRQDDPGQDHALPAFARHRYRRGAPSERSFFTSLHARDQVGI